MAKSLSQLVAEKNKWLKHDNLPDPKAEPQKTGPFAGEVDPVKSAEQKSAIQAKKDEAEFGIVDESAFERNSIQRQKDQETFSDAPETPTTSQIRADAAKKRQKMLQEQYDAKVKARAEKQKEDQFYSDLLTGDPNVIAPIAEPDEEEKLIQKQLEQAKGDAEYWESVLQSEKEAKILQADLDELKSWSDEDRAALDNYIQSRQSAFLSSLSPIAGGLPADYESNPLIAKYGRERLDQLASSYQRSQNAEKVKQAEQKGREDVKGLFSGTIANAASVGANLADTLLSPLSRIADMAAGKDDRYSTMDPYTAGDQARAYASGVRGRTAEIFAGDQYDENGDLIQDGGKLRELGALAYQGGMSALDTLARGYAGGSGVVGAGLAALVSFNQTLSDAAAKGASPEQAVTLATVNAGIEALTEKLPLDEIFKIAKGGAKPAAQVIKNVMKQAGIEILEEEASLIGSTLAEMAILREKSDYQQQIGKAIYEGKSLKQAEAEYFEGLKEEAINTAITSGFSGLFSAGGAEYKAARIGGQQGVQQLQTGQQETAELNPVQNEKATPAPVEAAAAEVRTPTYEELAAKNDIPVIKVGRNTSGKTYQQMKADVLNIATMGRWFDEPHTNTDTGMPVFLTKKTFSHSFSNLTAEFGTDTLLALENTPALIRDAVLTHVDPPQNPNKPETRVMTFLAAIEGENGVEPVKITVKEYDSNSDSPMPQNILSYFKKAKASEKYNTLYDLKALEVVGLETTKKESGASAIVADGSEEPGANSTPNSTIRVADLMGLVKGDAEKYIPKPAAVEQGSAPMVDTKEQSAEGGQTRDFRDSNTYMNSGLRSENANIRAGYRQDLRADPEAAKYAVKHNADTLAEANNRVSSPERANAALDDLLSRNDWDAEDVATSTLLLDKIMASGDRNAIEKLSQLRQQRKDVLSNYGQSIQAVTIGNETMRDAASPATAVDAFRSNLNSMKESETTYSKKRGVDFETWKQNIEKEVDNIGIAIAMVEDGNSDEMRNIIRQIAKARKTTAWFGRSERVTTVAQNVLKKLEFDDLKKIANTQVAAMADDYRRRSTGEVVSAIRKQSMLTSLKTFARNIGGNTAAGFADAVSESGAGQMADALLSRFTGKRTIGNDLFRAKEYAGAAKEAAQFAALCVELNIPIETDIDSSFKVASGKGSNEKYVGRTFRATGNPAMRALYGYQKYMSYALEVTDKVFEGGSNAAVQESLNRLRNSNLADEDVEALGQFTANKRTFKNATWEQDGETKGSVMARKGSQLKNATGVLGDVAMPFTNVPMNVAQTGIDYTTGIAKGVGEMVSIIKDAKAGKDIPVERQRQAASDFGRGVTGTAMICLATAAAAMGVIKVSDDDDWDKEALAQAEGRTGAQINWSALDRGLAGKSTEWQPEGDAISGLDFLEPFNTQLYLGYELAQEDGFLDMLKAYPGATLKSVWNSLMDSPVMTGLAEIEELIKDITGAEGPEDVMNAAAAYGGDVASSFIPQLVRQTAQYTDGYYRDTTGDTPMESAVNKIKAALPGVSQQLPVKYSGLGEAQQRGGFMNTFIDPTGTTTYKQNPVTTYLDDLSEKTGDTAIYPDYQAPKSIMVNGEEILISGKKMTEAYQKTYGENVNALYSGLINNAGFQNLPADVQSDAFAKAKEYATALAKASVSDYRDAPTESTEDLVRNIISGTVETGITKAFSDLSDNWKYDEDTAQSVEALDAAYQNYQAMGSAERKAFYEDASGRVKYFIDAKNDGMSTETFTDMYRQYRDIDGKDLSVKDKAQEWSYALEKAVDAGTITERQKDTMKGNMQFRYSFAAETAKFDTMIGAGIPTDRADQVIQALGGAIGTGSDGSVRDIDTRQTIAEMDGLNDSEIDAIMKCYMGDYDPNAEKKEYTELKYDYIREVLGLSPKAYAETYRAYLDERYEADKIAAIVDLGYDRAVATKLYYVYCGNQKKVPAVAWYEKKHGL